MIDLSESQQETELNWDDSKKKLKWRYYSRGVGTVKGTKKGGWGGQRLAKVGSYDYACLERRGEGNGFLNPVRPQAMEEGLLTGAVVLEGSSHCQKIRKCSTEQGKTSNSLSVCPSLASASDGCDDPKWYSPWSFSFQGQRPNTDSKWIGVGNGRKAQSLSVTSHNITEWCQLSCSPIWNLKCKVNHHQCFSYQIAGHKE